MDGKHTETEKWLKSGNKCMQGGSVCMNPFSCDFRSSGVVWCSKKSMLRKDREADGNIGLR